MMLVSNIRHRLPVLPVLSLLNQPRVRRESWTTETVAKAWVKGQECLADVSSVKEKTRDEGNSEETKSTRHKRKRKRSKRHESTESKQSTASPKIKHQHRKRKEHGEIIVQIPGGPELTVPRGVSNYRVCHEGFRYKLHMYRDTGKLRHFSMKKMQD